MSLIELKHKINELEFNYEDVRYIQNETPEYRYMIYILLNLYSIVGGRYKKLTDMDKQLYRNREYMEIKRLAIWGRNILSHRKEALKELESSNVKALGNILGGSKVLKGTRYRVDIRDMKGKVAVVCVYDCMARVQWAELSNAIIIKELFGERIIQLMVNMMLRCIPIKACRQKYKDEVYEAVEMAWGI